MPSSRALSLDSLIFSQSCILLDSLSTYDSILTPCTSCAKIDGPMKHMVAHHLALFSSHLMFRSSPAWSLNSLICSRSHMLLDWLSTYDSIFFQHVSSSQIEDLDARPLALLSSHLMLGSSPAPSLSCLILPQTCFLLD